MFFTGYSKVFDQLSNKQQRHLALGFLVLLLALIYWVAIVPLLDQSRFYQKSIEDSEFRLQRYKRSIAGKQAWQKQLTILKQREQSSQHFSNKGTPALASADFQKLIKTTVIDAGGRLTSTQVVPPSEEESFTKITIKVRMTGNMRALRDVLYTLEAARPMLLVDNLTLRPIRGRRDRKTRKMMPSDELNIYFDVVGYLRASTQP